MNRTRNRIAALACTVPALAAGSAFGVTLNNPGFETPASGNPDGWGVGGNVDAADVSTDFEHEGSQSLKFSAIVLNQNTDAFNPNFTASGDASTPVTFNTWVYKPAGDAITNHFYVLGIEYKKLNTPGDLGSGDTFVSGGEQIFETNSVAADIWTPLSYTLAATGAWDVVILHIKLVGLEPTSSGSFYVDDVSAVVPEPASAALFALAGATLLTRRRRA